MAAMGRGNSAARGDAEPARKLSRGGLLKVGASAAAVVGAGPLAHAAAGANPQRDPLAYLRLATYQPLRGATFTLQHPHGAIPAKLVVVESLTARGPKERARREQFSLIFETQRGEPLPQGTYQLEHQSLGQFPLFLVPVGRGKKGVELEAVVNRWLDATHP